MTTTTIPRGKSMFVTALSSADSEAKLATKIGDANLDWICVERYKAPGVNGEGEKWFNGPQLRDEGSYTYRRTLRKANCDLWLWGWPGVGSDAAKTFADAMGQAVQDFDAVGIVIDVEKDWIGVANSEVDTLMAELAKLECPVGVTSYGAAWNFSTFPWRAFAAADFGVPQIYDSSNNQGSSYPGRSVDAWQAEGFKRIVPASAAYDKTEDQMRQLLANTPTPEDAILWWSWANANSPDMWPVINDYRLQQLVA